MEQNSRPGAESGSADKKPLYKSPGFYIGIVIIAVVIIAGINWYNNSLKFINTDDAFVDADRLELGSKMMGRVVKLYRAEGDKVLKGELLAALDSTDIIARLNQADIMVQNTRLNIQLAKINLQKAELDFNRAKSQLENKVIPQAEFDNAQNRYESAEAQLKIVESKLTAAKAEIEVIKTQLANTKIFSSIKGVVAKKWAIEGEVVQPGQPIYSIYESDDLWVTAQLQETNINAISIGDSVEIDVDAYPDHIFKGRILKVGTNTAAQFSLIPPSNASGNFTKVTQRIPVKISIDNVSDNNTKYGLLPGMSVEVNIRIVKND